MQQNILNKQIKQVGNEVEWWSCLVGQHEGDDREFVHWLDVVLAQQKAGPGPQGVPSTKGAVEVRHGGCSNHPTTTGNN